MDISQKIRNDFLYLTVIFMQLVCSLMLSKQFNLIHFDIVYLLQFNITYNYKYDTCNTI